MANVTSADSISSSFEDPRAARQNSTRSDEEVVYRYHDQQGNLRYEKVVKPSHSSSEDPVVFLRLPNGQRGIEGEPSLPYRRLYFPTPSGFGSSFLTYHEGEADADAVADLNVPATTLSCDPGLDVPHDVVPHFARQNVAIFPDADPEGRYHAGNVARALRGTAASLKIVRLEGREEGEGVKEWVERKRQEGDSDEEIRDALTQAVDETPSLGEDSTLLESGDFGRDGPFWYFESGSNELKVNQEGLVDFLAGRGFGRFYGASDDSQLVHVEGHVIRPTTRERIRDHVNDYLEKEVPGDRGVRGALMRADNVYFSSGLLGYLPRLNKSFHRDTQEEAYFYYSNGFVEVTGEGYKLRPYSELDGLMWDRQIRDRRFMDLSHVADRSDWQFEQFLRRVMGNRDDKIRSLRSGLGYLQHGYKDPTLTKAVVFMDENDSGLADGRTGKSLVARALQETCSVKRLDGRNFRFNRFAFQEVDRSTRIVDFNDVREDFPFDHLFSVVTDDMTVERKGRDSITVPFSESPKFVISTNYVLAGGGSSFEDRIFEVEFSSHYGADHTPMDEFGRRFFEDWSEEEWARFDNTMMACVQEYLRDRLVEYERDAVEYRRLKQNTCASFAEWAPDAITPGEVIEKDILFESFRSEYEPDFDNLNRGIFGKWTTHFARMHGFEKVDSRPSRDGRRVWCVEFKVK